MTVRCMIAYCDAALNMTSVSLRATGGHLEVIVHAHKFHGLLFLVLVPPVAHVIEK